jgi:hypothetical protein
VRQELLLSDVHCIVHFVFDPSLWKAKQRCVLMW